ncbi:cytidylate kinase [Muribaculaceae bacterium]|jgi:cytidylate kinase|nr:(d)CMP kinase [Muribaculaceae bacterium]GFI05438.1 cytidylate kinase [Muribaculaceae bacterium]
MKNIIIAIDGFSSSGKSTMAKALARKIGYRYIDSGAMYRAVTLWAIENGLIGSDGTADETAVAAGLSDVKIDFAVTPDGQHTILDGRDVEKEIRTMGVSAHVSTIAAIAAVRRDLVARQQQFGREKGIVMDGRDIGTTVFPDAELKIFVNASAETRAMRRFEELKAKGEDTDYEDVLANVRHRDHIDMTRAESPLRRADDAVDLDNSHMTVQEQDEWLLARFRKAAED